LPEDAEITRARAAELLAFLPGFEAPHRAYVKRWEGGAGSDKVSTFPFPVYEEDVVAFFIAAGQSWWSDYGYRPEQAAAMVQDDAIITGATLGELRTMLTYCVRGERFADGHWAHLLETGRVQAILRRLAELAPELP
jgi:hypothetical protein